MKFWTTVNRVIRESDIILHVVDARDIEGTLNKEIEDKAKRKTIIYVINKCDLSSQRKLEKEKKKFEKAVFVSSTEYHGMKKLRDMLIIEGKRLGIKPKVGVVGYPNTGKSSVINALKGKGSARTSLQSGFTRGKQNIATKHFTLVDTPGVIPYKEKGSLISKDWTKIKDPEDAVLDLKLIESYDKLEEYAKKKKMLKKGGIPDTNRAARQLLKNWQEGNI